MKSLWTWSTKIAILQFFPEVSTDLNHYYHFVDFVAKDISGLLKVRKKWDLNV